ncbi:MAG: hypothetical protein MUF87_12665 [Anaerolineae bacterium]|jgi:hypothetical protein|nr:hypothetical protein [Anaerolineae bacterium]
MQNLTRVCVLTVTLLIVLSGALQAQSTQDSLELVIALDLSASLSLPRGSNPPQVDAGQALTLAEEATDPNNVRFDATRFTLDWINDYIASRDLSDSFAVNASVLGFYTTDSGGPQIAPMLNRQTLDGSVTLSPFAPQLQSGARHAEFLTVYEQAQQTFSANPNARQVLVVVTDSVPCAYNWGGLGLSQGFPYGSSQPRMRDRDCLNTSTMIDHIEHASTQILLPDVEQYVFHLAPESGYWLEQLVEVREAWIESLPDDRFIEVPDVQALPATLFEAIVGEFSIALTSVDDLSALGITAVEPGNFEVAPYQSRLDVIAFTLANQNLSFNGPTGTVRSTERLYNSDTGLISWQRFTQPPPGGWSADGAAGTLYLSYLPATSAAWVEQWDGEAWERVGNTRNTQPAQLARVRLVYQILSDTDEPLTNADFIPQISATFNYPEGARVPLTNWRISDNRFVSDALILTDSGRYQAEITVQPQTSWARISTANVPIVVATPETTLTPQASPTPTEERNASQGLYEFLIPDPIASFEASPIVFQAQLGSESQQAALETEGQLEITRAARLPLVISATSNGRAIPVPEMISAVLTLDGEGCLPADSFPLERSGDSLSTTATPLRFETGNCRVAVALNLTSEDLPVANQTILLETLPLGLINVGATRRLDFALLKTGGEEVVLRASQTVGNPNATTAYTMEDYVTLPQTDPLFPLTWRYQTLNLEVSFLDEQSGEFVNPLFVDGSTETVPLVLRIIPVSGGEDIASSNNIQLTKSAREGVYSATIQGLAPGDYRLEVELLDGDEDPNNLEPRLAERYEYIPELTTPVANPILTATLTVSPNIGRLALIYGSLGVTALLMLGLVAGVGQFIGVRMNPLRGSIAIYTRAPGKHPVLVWEHLIPGGRNHYQVPDVALIIAPELIGENIEQMKLSTKRSRSISAGGKAYVETQVQGQTKTELLEVDHPWNFHTSQRGVDYYLVKRLDNSVEIDPEKFTS